MGFLGFMKKKKNASTHDTELLDIPLPPPKMNGEDTELPKFADENPIDELKLPDIPDFEQQAGLDEVPDLTESKTDKLAMPESIDLMPEMPSIDEPPEPEENAYDHTPANPARQLFPKLNDMPAKRGEIFIRGDDYREVLEGIDELLAIQKEKTEKQETQPFKTDEKQLEKLETAIEDIQRSLIVAEKMLFE